MAVEHRFETKIKQELKQNFKNIRFLQEINAAKKIKHIHEITSQLFFKCS